MMEALSDNDSVVTAATIWNWTDKDPALSSVDQMDGLAWVAAAGR